MLFINHCSSKKVYGLHKTLKKILYAKHSNPYPTDSNQLAWQNVLVPFVLSLRPINLQHCMLDRVMLVESHPNLLFLALQWAQCSLCPRCKMVRFYIICCTHRDVKSCQNTDYYCRTPEGEVKLLQQDSVVFFTGSKALGWSACAVQDKLWMSLFWFTLAG